MALLRRRRARSCCCLQPRSGSTSARLRGWGGESRLADTRIPHHPHVRAHHAAVPPHSQAQSPSHAATPSGSLADDERDEAAAPPGWPARASRWPVQRCGTGSPKGPSWPARLPTREDRARGQILGKMACLRSLQSEIPRDGGRMTRSSLHSRLRAEILHGIDTWNVFSIARGEELRPFSTCV